MANELMTAEQAAEEIGVSSRTVRRRLSKAGLGQRAGKLWLLSHNELELIRGRILPVSKPRPPLRLGPRA